MDNYNIFLCYRGEQAGLLARSIYQEIKSYKNTKLKVFYAPECISKGVDFVSKCEEIASKVSLMITFITKDFFDRIHDKDDVVALELKSALNNPSCAFLPIIFKDFNFNEAKEKIRDIFTDEEISRITHINAINYTDVYTFNSFPLLGAILEHFSIRKDDIDEDVSQKRLDDKNKEKLSSWAGESNKKEKKRLYRQQRLLLKYDLPVFEKLLAGKKNINVLDLGSGNGSAIMERIGSREEINKIIGLEIVNENVIKANETYGSDKVKFYQMDVESEDFEDRLEEIMDENDIESFDLVSVLALLSYLKNPSRVFKLVKKFVSSDSHIIVRNIDDGYNVAYPDEMGEFKRALTMLQLCTSNGYRFDGRKIFTTLQSRGYKDISLDNLVLTTVNMSVEEKEDFFLTVFAFIKKGLEDELLLSPDSPDLLDQYKWYNNVYDKLEQEFMNPAFFFSFGFMIFTAKIK